MTVKTSVSISDQQDAFARRLVEEGRYSSVSAVVQQGLELLREQTERKEAELAALRALIDVDAKAPSCRRGNHTRIEMIARKRAQYGYNVQLSEESEVDLDRIFDHLLRPMFIWANRSKKPLNTLRSACGRFGPISSPSDGPLIKERFPSNRAGPAARHKNRGIIYFDIDDFTQSVRVIAVFFGGQDHDNHILKRSAISRRCVTIDQSRKNPSHSNSMINSSTARL